MTAWVTTLLGSAALLFSASVLATNNTTLPNPDCGADRIDERVTVEHLYDGDTARLSDGRKVRFIGIDTPEIGHHGAPSQPWASEAHDLLQALLEKSGHTLGLRYDMERHDRYKRDLAHVYLSDGSSVAAHLLERGLATLLPIPPNVWNSSCYQALEQRARTAQRGVWGLPEYQPVHAAQLQHDDADTRTGRRPGARTNTRMIKGKVTATHLENGDAWLTLDNTVMLHIGQRDRKYFAGQTPGTFPVGMLGHTVIARGRLYFTKGVPRMQVRHPSTLQVMQ